MEQKDTDYFDPIARQENWNCNICGATIAGGCKKCPICGNNKNPEAEVATDKKKIRSWHGFHGVSRVGTGTRRARTRCK